MLWELLSAWSQNPRNATTFRYPRGHPTHDLPPAESEAQGPQTKPFLNQRWGTHPPPSTASTPPAQPACHPDPPRRWQARYEACPNRHIFHLCDCLFLRSLASTGSVAALLRSWNSSFIATSPTGSRSARKTGVATGGSAWPKPKSCHCQDRAAGVFDDDGLTGTCMDGTGWDGQAFYFSLIIE